MYNSATRALKVLEGLGLFRLQSHATLALQFEHHAASQPDQLFLRYEEQRYSYGQANALINRHAHAYRALGVAKGFCVALMIENRPEFLWHMFALHKLGAIASLINTHLRGDALVHAIRVCNPRRVVVGSEVWASWSGIQSQLRELVDFVDVDADPSLETIPDATPWARRLVGTSSDNPPETGRHTLADQAAFIYTSGTTGLPKAAVVRHHRFYRAGRIWAGLAFRFRPGDVLYNCLPLYHANSAALATGSVITAGVTMALSRRFSRTRFWDEVRASEATGFIYIGELCRYLMNSEPSPRDRDHRVRAISGNGLRPDIWRSFERRFGIPRIVEFYGATESNCITLNMFGLSETVGPKLPGMALARWNQDDASFVRDAQGRLVHAKLGEPGVLLGRIQRRSQFDGYQDKTASDSKVVRNAFADGDAWFNSGDLLRLDALRHLHFVDRLGDTYRWKGENVATSEVQEQLCTWEPVREALVYGVTVPRAEGRAGMAALVLAAGARFDPAGLRRHLEARLPSYARPRFVRITTELVTTSTFKPKKNELQKEGYDPRAIQDELYVLHPGQDAYVPLTPELHDALSAGRLLL